MNKANQPDGRVTVIEDRLVYVRELEKPTPDSVSEAADMVRELTKDWEKFSIIVEFPTSVTPSSAVRHRVVEETRPLIEKLSHVSVVTKPNVFLSINIKFIGAFSGLRSISVHQSRDEAIEEARKKLKN